jgi:hypothetical protein
VPPSSIPQIPGGNPAQRTPRPGQHGSRRPSAGKPATGRTGWTPTEDAGHTVAYVN